jgi:hypothetical protein
MTTLQKPFFDQAKIIICRADKKSKNRMRGKKAKACRFSIRCKIFRSCFALLKVLDFLRL